MTKHELELEVAALKRRVARGERTLRLLARREAERVPVVSPRQGRRIVVPARSETLERGAGWSL